MDSKINQYKLTEKHITTIKSPVNNIWKALILLKIDFNLRQSIAMRILLSYPLLLQR